jgi:hypothetical protein
MQKKMLLAVPFMIALAHATPAAASPAVRCRVGNGKPATYLDSVHACLKARADGKKVKFEKGEDPDAKKEKEGDA